MGQTWTQQPRSALPRPRATISAAPRKPRPLWRWHCGFPAAATGYGTSGDQGARQLASDQGKELVSQLRGPAMAAGKDALLALHEA